MKQFDYRQPTEIRFGGGRNLEAGPVVSRYGKRCLLVTRPVTKASDSFVSAVLTSLEMNDISVRHFDGVIPNPTTECITAGAEMAVGHRADVVLGLGGGSSMDAAKAIAVEATHDGTSWDYLFYRKTQPTEKTLPIIAVTTTSGTGSHVTQVAVVTHTARRDKSAIYHPYIFPSVAIVDPDQMLTLPEHVTASTGFDAFCHAFESTLHKETSPYVELMAWEAIRQVISHLPAAVQDGRSWAARSALAWADTLAGLCIANAGVTLPHGIGMAIGGMYPHVMHGESLALNYPAFTRFTCASAVPQFAKLGRLLNNELVDASDEKAAERSCDELDELMKTIGMWMSLEDKGVPEEELPALAKQSMVLPDYQSNPRVATESEMLEIIQQCYRR